MKHILVLTLFILSIFCAQVSYAISIGGSVRGGGFGFGASSDGSATVSGGRGPASGSVRVEGGSDASSNQNSSSSSSQSSSSSSAGQNIDVIFEISREELPKYKGKTPKVYARMNGALIFPELLYLAYNRDNKTIETKVIDADGLISHGASRDQDIIVRMPKGECKMKGEDYICPK